MFVENLKCVILYYTIKTTCNEILNNIRCE